jgi:PAS domain S-box-containing protein
VSSSDPHRLDAEISAMRERLSDLEALRDALTSGSVDAIVVGPDDDRKRVLLLSGAYARYRRLVEDMEQGAVTVSRRGEIIFANRSFAAMLKASVSDLFRQPLSHFVAPSHQETLALLLSPRDKRRSVDVALQDRNGVQHVARLSLISDQEEFLTIMVTDLTRDEELREAGETVSAISSGGADAVVRNGDQVVLLDSGAGGPRAADVAAAVLRIRTLVESLKARPGLGAAERSIVEALDRQAAQLADLGGPAALQAP